MRAKVKADGRIIEVEKAMIGYAECAVANIEGFPAQNFYSEKELEFLPDTHMNTMEQRAEEYIKSSRAQLLGCKKNLIKEAYLAGAVEALTAQWRSVEDELPKFGDEFILRYRTKHKGSWLTITQVETRHDWADPFDEKDIDILAWMPIPETPERKRMKRTDR